jgi:hypothetical protein
VLRSLPKRVLGRPFRWDREEGRSCKSGAAWKLLKAYKVFDDDSELRKVKEGVREEKEES